MSDDTLLIAPGLYGVFDGATDARAQIVGGRSSGRFASETVAEECLAIFGAGCGFDMPAADIAARLNAALRKGAAAFDGVPTTTLALLATSGERARLLTIGDSGIRVNGQNILRHLKPIDDVSTEARVRIFRILRARMPDPDACEAATRRVIFLGLDAATADDIITPAERDTTITAVCDTLSARLPAGPIEEFLRGGIILQSRFANLSGNALGYSALNGTETTPDDIVETWMPLAELGTAELFSDGYFHLPDTAALADWEAGVVQVETEDLHMLDLRPNVKGATQDEFADDRAVIIIDRR